MAVLRPPWGKKRNPPIKEFYESNIPPLSKDEETLNKIIEFCKRENITFNCMEDARDFNSIIYIRIPYKRRYKDEKKNY